MPDPSRTRLCERCWCLLPTGTVLRVSRHAEQSPDDPDVVVGELLSYRHLDDDPSCAGTPTAPALRIAAPQAGSGRAA